MPTGQVWSIKPASINLMQKIKDQSFLLCANWKMNKNPILTRQYIRQIRKLVASQDQKKFVFFAPAFTLSVLAEELASSAFGYGAQNCHFEDQGAFTGENSPLVLKQMGATHCLVGHSERRQFFFESEKIIYKKVVAVLKNSLQPVICVGEKAEERKEGKSFDVIERQLSDILQNVEFSDDICIAYEPVWAIGSGKSAFPEQIADMQIHIRKLCDSSGKKLRFLYGGSVNQENVKALARIPRVDGFLVGGASLDPKNFFNLFVALSS